MASGVVYGNGYSTSCSLNVCSTCQGPSVFLRSIGVATLRMQKGVVDGKHTAKYVHGSSQVQSNCPTPAIRKHCQTPKAVATAENKA